MRAPFNIILATLFAGVAATVCALNKQSARESFVGNYPVKIGVYYYPGWSKNLKFARYPDPWLPIRQYPTRMPLGGEYTDSAPATLDRQIRQMSGAGISFVVFDYYFSKAASPRLDQALAAYLSLNDKRGVDFALLWANHDEFLNSNATWEKQVDIWIEAYFKDPSYLKVDGKPVLIILSPNKFRKSAASFGAEPRELLDFAQRSAKKQGLKGIIFAGGGGPRPDFISTGLANKEGYQALTDYNMGTADLKLDSFGFDRRDRAYRKYWDSYDRNGTLPAILPITVGWDRTPWGGSREDGAIPTPAQFETHFSAALARIRSKRNPLARIGIICCWNEYGEGSVLEPTVGRGSALLNVVQQQLRNEDKVVHER